MADIPFFPVVAITKKFSLRYVPRIPNVGEDGGQSIIPCFLLGISKVLQSFCSLFGPFHWEKRDVSHSFFLNLRTDWGTAALRAALRCNGHK